MARSACHAATEDEARWVGRVRHVVSLGTPHMGAPLEQLVHVASAGLNALPEIRPFGAVLRRRSAGIRDLRQGSLVDEDWRDRDPDALVLEASASGRSRDRLIPFQAEHGMHVGGTYHLALLNHPEV